MSIEKIKTVKEFTDKNKEKCSSCDSIATWFYMPSYEGKKQEDDYYCDEHVPRGCGCNYHHTNPEDFYPPADEGEKPVGIEGKDWKWVIEPETEESDAITLKDGLWVTLDEQGRKWPCCEFMHDEDGWEKE